MINYTVYDHIEEYFYQEVLNNFGIDKEGIHNLIFKDFDSDFFVNIFGLTHCTDSDLLIELRVTSLEAKNYLKILNDKKFQIIFDSKTYNCRIYLEYRKIKKSLKLDDKMKSDIHKALFSTLKQNDENKATDLENSNAVIYENCFMHEFEIFYFMKLHETVLEHFKSFDKTQFYFKYNGFSYKGFLKIV